jgi:RimJ/RimL family protein N-acetyltransferase
VIPGELGLVYLTAADKEHVVETTAWLNDRGVARWMIDQLVPDSLAKQKAFYEKLETSDEMHLFEVHVAETDRYVGVVGYDGVDLRHRFAEIGLFIGPEDARGKGYGRDALLTGLRFGFDTLGLHTVFLSTVDDNERAIALYRDVGFRQVGHIREQIFSRRHRRTVALATRDDEL